VLEIPESKKKTLRFKCPKCRSVVSVRNPRHEGESELPEDIRRRRREKREKRERDEGGGGEDRRRGGEGGRKRKGDR
jgi:hypothetical protein